MLTLTRARTDEDLEADRTVFQVGLPDDRCPSVADLRRTLEHRNRRARLERGDRGRHPADAATRDDHLRCAAHHIILF